MDRDKMSNLYRGPSIDDSYQVSVHLAEGFQWRIKCEKLTDNFGIWPQKLYLGKFDDSKASVHKHHLAAVWLIYGGIMHVQLWWQWFYGFVK